MQNPWSLYLSIDELPLTRFITCVTTGDLSPLIKDGTVPAGVLDSTWLHIYSDYCNRIGGVQISAMITRSKQINELSSKLSRMQSLLTAAAILPCDEISAAFKAEGFKLDADADYDTYHQQLRVIAAKLKPESMKLDRLLNEQPKTSDKESVTARSFNLTLMAISDSVKYEIRAENLTTGQYCDRVAQLRDRIEAQVAAQRNNRH